jgi:hypothetical protein
MVSSKSEQATLVQYGERTTVTCSDLVDRPLVRSMEHID